MNWKVLKTEDGVSSSIRPAQVHGSIWMFSLIYLLLFCLFLSYWIGRSNMDQSLNRLKWMSSIATFSNKREFKDA